jgi:chromosomal replication initiation ATPase DnaA
MYAEKDDWSDRYHGHNPKFLRRVWAKRNPKPEKVPSVKEILIAARNEREEQERREVEAVKATIAKYRTHNIIGCRTEAREIIMRVAKWRGVQFEAIIGPRRTRHIVAARFEAIRAVADARPDLSLPQLGRIFKRDHTSIIHALRATALPGEHHRISTEKDTLACL